MMRSGAFGSKAWMSELAHHAGSRESGKKGGRPRLHKSG